MEAWIHDFQIAPRIDHIANWIEFDERRSQSCRVQIAFVHVLAIENQDVILGVNADSAKAAKRPAIRQCLRPGKIGLVLRGGGLRLYRSSAVVGTDLEVGSCGNRRDQSRRSDDDLHIHWSVPFSSR